VRGQAGHKDNVPAESFFPAPTQGILFRRVAPADWREPVDSSARRWLRRFASRTGCACWSRPGDS